MSGMGGRRTIGVENVELARADQVQGHSLNPHTKRRKALTRFVTFYRIVATVLTITFLHMGGDARAALLTVVNADFESPGGQYSVPTGWNVTGSAKSYPTDMLADQLLPHTGNAAFTEGSPWFGAGPGSFAQTIGGYTVQANTTYTLSVWVGGRIEESTYFFGGSRIELYDPASGIVLASEQYDRDTPGRPNGGWITSTAVFTTGSSGSAIGAPLQIRLFGLYESADEGYPQTWFDNVTLDASPAGAVPEPTTLAIWSALGGLGMIAARWRRRAA